MNKRARFCGAALVAIFCGLAPGRRRHKPRAGARERPRLLAPAMRSRPSRSFPRWQDKLRRHARIRLSLGVAALDSGRTRTDHAPSSACSRSFPTTRERRWISRAPTSDGLVRPRRGGLPQASRKQPSPAAMIAINRYSTRSRRASARRRRAGRVRRAGAGLRLQHHRRCRRTSERRGQAFKLIGSRPRATRSSDPRLRAGCDRAEYTTRSPAAGASSAAGSCAGVSTIARATSTSPRARCTAAVRSTRATTSTIARIFSPFYQKGAAPGDPRPPTTVEWRA